MATKKGVVQNKTIESKAQLKCVRGRNPHEFFKAYATNVIVDVTDLDIRLSLMNEVLESSKEKIAVCDGMVILHPQAAKLLVEQLNIALKSFDGKDVAQVSESRRELIKILKEKSNIIE